MTIRHSSLFFAQLLGFVFFGLAGCAAAPEQDGSIAVNDPLEGMNRVMWNFNYDYLDPYFVRPVSLAYVNYTPRPVRSGIGNFLSNLDEPSSMVNNLIMGNGDKAVTHLTRFFINTTVGLGGIIDIASAAEITAYEDKTFGDAVGHYGVGNGPYVMVPGYGPWTARETFELVDSTYVPLAYLNFWAGLGKWALEGMETRAQLVQQEALIERSPDPYAFTRDAYLQRRDFTAEIERTAQDEFDEDEFDDLLDEF
ncbi:MlaA family lipoprotein [Vibrio sp. WXL103]|uniref:MlaA family lipoprotein n=1 Tax=unclassified Vibrio TaxID=2614977 RepID=UPI003EC9291F